MNAEGRRQRLLSLQRSCGLFLHPLYGSQIDASGRGEFILRPGLFGAKLKDQICVDFHT